METADATPLKIGLYLRVSTEEQTTAPQRHELLEFCTRRGWSNLVEYADTISGAKFTRTGLDKMMKAVRTKKLDVILCVKLDRLGRSLSHMAQMVEEFDKHKVALICPGQAIDTSSDNPAGKLQMHILMAVAQFERSLIRERTKAGLIAAKARGSLIGRPKVADEMRVKVAECLARVPRPNLRAVAKELGISLGTVAKLAKLAAS